MKVTTESQTLTKHTMIIGAYAGAAFIFSYLIFYLGNILFAPFSEYLIYLISMGAIYFGVTQYQFRFLDEPIQYITSLKAGFLINFWASLILSFFIYLLISYIDPSLRNTYLDYFENYINQSSSYSDEQINTLLDFYRTFLTPSVISIMELIGKTFMGFLFSLIISIFIVRKNKRLKQ